MDDDAVLVIRALSIWLNRRNIEHEIDHRQLVVYDSEYYVAGILWVDDGKLHVHIPARRSYIHNDKMREVDIADPGLMDIVQQMLHERMGRLLY